MAVGNADLPIALHLGDFFGRGLGEKPQAAVVVDVLDAHRATVERAVLLNAREHGDMDAAGQLAELLQRLSMDTC